jgi:hypothetical protein
MTLNSEERHPLEEMVSEGFLQAAERQDGWEEMREHDGVIIARRKYVGHLFCFILLVCWLEVLVCWGGGVLFV